MGMAASQARLLSITARMSDNELRSQIINNFKMRLASESSKVSEDYVSALNDAVMMMSNYDLLGNEQYQELTFNSLTAYSSHNTQYGLTNASGQMLVSESEGNLYKTANGSLDKYLGLHGLEYGTSFFSPETFGLTSTSDPIQLTNADGSKYSTISVDELKSLYEGGPSTLSYDQAVSSSYFEAADEALHEVEIAEILFRRALSTAISQWASTNLVFNDTSISASDFYYNKLFGVDGSTTGNSLFEQVRLLANSSYKAEIDKKETDLRTIYKFSKGGANGNVDAIFVGLDFEDPAVQHTSLEKLMKTGVTELSLGLDQYVKFVDNDDKNDYKELRFEVVDDEKYEITHVNGHGTWGSQEDGFDLDNAEDYYWVYIGNKKYSAFFDYDKDKNISNISKSIHFNFTILDKSDAEKPVSTTYYYNYDEDTNGNINVRVNQQMEVSDYKDIYNSCKAEIFEGLYENLDFAYILAHRNVEPIKTIMTYGPDSGKAAKAADDYDAAVNKMITILFGSLTSDQRTKLSNSVSSFSDFEALKKFAEDNKISTTVGFKAVDLVNTVDPILNEFGEPKYGWVDTNNPSENADAKVTWYTNLFNRMKEGYKVLEDGLASSNDWIEYALENGIVTIEQVDKTNKWVANNYTNISSITQVTDNVAVARAEAEYNRAMNRIEEKDQRYDLELKNIDTEHNSLQTEYESIKSVISKNIERTFQMYS